MKKLVAFLLAAITVLGACAFADEGKIYDGVTLKLLGYNFAYAFAADGSMKRATDSNMPIYAALYEFAEKTGVKYEHVSGDLAALIASGEVPDLWNTNNVFPEASAQGLIEAWDAEWVAKLGEKHGEGWLNAMNYAGQCYGIVHKWSSLGALQYNYTKMVDLGIKTPREYYLDGEWTWENFFKMLNECVIDADGDGNLEYDAIGKYNWNSYMLADVAIDENGNAVSLVDTERYRTLHNYIYNAYQTGAISNHGNGLNRNGTSYTLCRWRLSEPYTLGNENAVGFVQDGDYIDVIMPPKMNAEDTEQGFGVNFVYMLRPAGAGAKDAKTVEAAYALVDFIYECEEQFMNICSGGAYPFEGKGITGTTPESKAWMELLKTTLEKDIAATTELPEYDAEWVTILANWYNTAPVFFRELKIPGLQNNQITSDDALNNPTATFVAQFAPVHQAQCDAFNLLYADE